MLPKTERFGNQMPFCEPYWYQGYHSPHYTEKHKEFRNKVHKTNVKVRAFIDTELRPHVDEWIKNGYPPSLHEKVYQAGISGIMAPVEYGGQRTPDVDAFFELIMCDELARLSGGGVLGQLAINSMALPPILSVGSTYLKDKGNFELRHSYSRCRHREEEHLFSHLGAVRRLGCCQHSDHCSSRG